jgi:hypothetical protein
MPLPVATGAASSPPAGTRRLRRRGPNQSIPAKGYWLSGPDNHHQQTVTGTPDHPEPSHSVEPATGDPATPVALSAGPGQQPGSRQPSTTAQRALTPTRSPLHPTGSGWPPELVKEATQTMRIMAVCNNCQRDLLLSQLVEGPEITGR